MPPSRAPAQPGPARLSEGPRELPRYAADTFQQVEATHIDRNVHQRAQTMNLVGPDSLAGASTASSHPGASFEPHRDTEALPGFRAAMLVRVRAAGLEVPLWSLVTPLVILGALAAALGAAAVSDAPPKLATESSGAALAAPSEAEPAPGAAPAPGAHALPPAESSRAVAGSLPPAKAPGAAPEATPEKYTAAQILSLAGQRSQGAVSAAEQLSRELDRDPGLVKEPKVLAQVRELSENPETARIVLGSLAALPAPLGPDLLYEIWTGTVQRNEVTELARALLYSSDTRPKASPALSVALDLRTATTCDESKAALPRAEKVGDRRSLHLLLKLQRRYGCGPNKRQDCNPCLRKGDELEAAVKAVKERREPPSFAR